MDTNIDTSIIPSCIVTDKISAILVCQHIKGTETTKPDRDGPQYLATNTINPDLLEKLRSGRSYKATGKIDGTGCIVKDGALFKKRDLKTPEARANPPSGWIETGRDQGTGHLIGFMPLDKTNKSDQWHIACHTSDDHIMVLDASRGFNDLQYKEVLTTSLNGLSVEVVGPNFQKNPHNLAMHCVTLHGDILLNNFPDLTQSDSDLLQRIKDWFDSSDQGPFLEGVVIHLDDGSMFKLHRHHLGMKWNVTTNAQKPKTKKSYYKKTKY